MRRCPICDQDFNWATRRSTPVHLRALSGYPELVLHEPNHIYIGHFVPHESTVAQGGFRTVLWNAPKDLRAAVEDVVAFCTYLNNYCRNLQEGATSQLRSLFKQAVGFSVEDAEM